jgi:hypothetical protein
MSIPMTSFAPALAANMERMPVPQPTWRGGGSGQREGREGGNGKSRAHIQHDLVFEQVRVLLDSVAVRQGTDGVLEHFLVDAWRENTGDQTTACWRARCRHSPK